MATVEELEKAVDELPPTDYARFRDWFMERENDRWDQEIEAHSASGALDHILREVQEDIAAGRVKSLDEITYGP